MKHLVRPSTLWPVVRCLAVAALSIPGATAPIGAQTPAPIVVESPTLVAGQMMPRTYSPDGRNASPPITWRGLPSGTREIVVICEDHGAGNPPPWVHWLVYNIPGNATGLPEGLPIDPRDPMPASLAGAVHGDNGWGLPMYRGPAPPAGRTNTYQFVVYALDQRLNLAPGLTRAEVLAAIEGHVIGKGEIAALYTRQPMTSPSGL